MPARLKLLALAHAQSTKAREPEVTPQQLADVELVMAVLSGPPDRRRHLALRLVSDTGNLWRLARQSRADLRAMGVGVEEAIRLGACLELGRRASLKPSDGRAVRSPQDAFECVAGQFVGEERERFVVVVLDVKNRPRHLRVVSEGAIDVCPVDPREVFALALRERGSAILVAHNHPSGDATPSSEDVTLTGRLAAAGELLGIPLLDHIVVGRLAGEEEPSFVSLAERGLLGRRLESKVAARQ